MMAKRTRTVFTEAMRNAAVADLGTMSIEQLVKKHKLGSASMVYRWKKNATQPAPAATAIEPGEPPTASNNEKANGNAGYVAHVMELLDARVRKHGVRSLTKQDLYTLLLFNAQ